ncbi:hypothetical protein XENOCAPTIV_029961 [Xenoophorus captivus]|uniref:Uncharacterized protein n=1 Tax=Xenoophorus captivus TaxID=1517983 RepID=A0ABV0QXA5_9TELE
MWKNPWPTVNHAELNELVLVLGGDVSGRNPLGLFRIQFVDQPKPPDEVLDITGVSPSTSPTTPPQALVTYLNVSSPEVILQVETGFSYKNTWLEWITQWITSGMQREYSRLTFPPSRTYTGLGSGKELLKSLQTPHTLHINCSELYLQAAATEHCSLKPAATETVSSPRRFLC